MCLNNILFVFTMCEETSLGLSDVQRVNSLEEFKDALRQHELETSTKYVFWKGDKAFSSEIGTLAVAPRMQVNWDGIIPYLYIGARTYLCHQGRDINTYQKKKYAELRDHKISVITKTEKAKTSKFIKDRLSKGEQLLGEDKYLFHLPDISEHQFHTMATLPDSPNVQKNKPVPKRRKGKQTLTGSASKKQRLMKMCNSHMDSLRSSMPSLQEHSLIELENELGYLLQAVSSLAKEDVVQPKNVIYCYKFGESEGHTSTDLVEEVVS